MSFIRLQGIFAGFKANEIVYDLYTGIGTIANLLQVRLKKLSGLNTHNQPLKMLRKIQKTIKFTILNFLQVIL